MGGRTSTLLIALAGIAAVAVLGWSLAASLSLAGEAPYLLGSLGIVTALIAAVLIAKDLVTWPMRALAPRLSWFCTLLARIFSGTTSAKRRASNSNHHARPAVASVSRRGAEQRRPATAKQEERVGGGPAVRKQH